MNSLRFVIDRGLRSIPAVASTPNCYIPHKRLFSSKSSKEDERKVETEASPLLSPTTKSTLLYKAKSSKATFPRSLLGFTTVHAGYWSWYVFDFTPSLQSSAVITDPIDPTVGYIGLGLSIFMSIGSMVYPKSLICEISKSKTASVESDAGSTTQHLHVKTFGLPFVLPSSKSTQYELGDIVIDSPNDVTKILTEYNGYMGKFPGHIAIHAEGTYTNLLMNMTEEDADEEIMDGELLLQSLMPGQTGAAAISRGGKKGKGTADANAPMKTLKVKNKLKKYKAKR